MTLRPLLLALSLSLGLGLGTSSVALAQSANPMWLDVAPASGFAGARRFIKVGADRGAFTAVRIDATAGQVTVNQIVIEFFDGPPVIARRLARDLDGRQPFRIGLEGCAPRAIKRIVVYGTHNDNGAFTVALH